MARALKIGAAAATSILIVLVARGDAARPCRPIDFTPEAAAQYRDELPALDFVPIEPCSTRSDLEVVRVVRTDEPTQPTLRSITFAVERRGEGGLFFHATNGRPNLYEGPEEARGLRFESGGVVAGGYIGRFDDGPQLAFLIWSVDGIYYELTAIIRPWLRASEIQAIAVGMIEASAATTAAGP